MDSDTPALSIRGLVKEYAGGVTAVNNLSLDVPKGSFFGFLGPNGAGKSTTIHCITGIVLPTAGSIKVFGIDAVNDYVAARRKVGLSPQDFNTDFFGVVWKTLDYMGGYYGMPKAERRERVEYLIERFGLTKYRDAKFNTLSGGFKRRVMLARALVHDPELLILDEPTAGVDVELRLDLWRYFTELNREGKTIILTSHYLEEVEKLCDRIAVVSHGRVAAEGTKEALTAGQRLEDVYLSITKNHAGEA